MGFRIGDSRQQAAARPIVSHPVFESDVDVERLDKLVKYYNYHRIEERYGIPFKRFVEMVERGSWSDFIS